jgi:hypothetical protein
VSAARRLGGLSRRARLQLAERYVWWQEPTETLRTPPTLLRQILRLGTEDDYLAARGYWGEAAFKRALVDASPGALDARSWIFWHRHYHLKSKPFPRRHFG